MSDKNGFCLTINSSEKSYLNYFPFSNQKKSPSTERNMFFLSLTHASRLIHETGLYNRRYKPVINPAIQHIEAKRFHVRIKDQ